MLNTLVKTVLFTNKDFPRGCVWLEGVPHPAGAASSGGSEKNASSREIHHQNELLNFITVIMVTASWYESP